jgi:signal transduction histidine kinase
MSAKAWTIVPPIKEYRSDHNLAAMGATAAILAHEMSNQLNCLSFQTRLMEERVANQKLCQQDAVLSLLPVLRRGIDQLCALLDEFRSLGQPQRLALQPTSLVTLISELLESLKAQYAEQGVRIELSVSGVLPLLRIDYRKFKQALLNLFKNALEAMPEGGTLTVRLYKSRRIVCVEVQDSGMGIPEDLDSFEPFTTTKSHGTGLGMAVVCQVVSAHGGAIDYITQREKGTTFRVSLPLGVAKHNANDFSISIAANSFDTPTAKKNKSLAGAPSAPAKRG